MARFAVALTCMDGRYHEAVVAWVKATYGVDYVHLVTLMGLDGVLADRTIATVREAVEGARQVHDANPVIVAGHHGCVGNPVDDSTHREHVARATRRVDTWVYPLAAVGVFVESDRSVVPI